MTWVLTHPRNLVSHSMTDGISAYAGELEGFRWPYFVPRLRDYEGFQVEGVTEDCFWLEDEAGGSKVER